MEINFIRSGGKKNSMGRSNRENSEQKSISVWYMFLCMTVEYDSISVMQRVLTVWVMPSPWLVFCVDWLRSVGWLLSLLRWSESLRKQARWEVWLYLIPPPACTRWAGITTHRFHLLSSTASMEPLSRALQMCFTKHNFAQLWNYSNSSDVFC